MDFAVGRRARFARTLRFASYEIMPIRKYLSDRSKDVVWVVAPLVGQSRIIVFKVRRPDLGDDFRRASMVPIFY